MYTQCPECLTIYRIVAESLAGGRGNFRCGHCGGVFDALPTLIEKLPLEVVGELPRHPQPQVPPVLQIPAMHPRIPATEEPRSKLQSLDLPLTHEPRIPATAEPRSKLQSLDLPLTHEPRIPATAEPRSRTPGLDLPLTHEPRIPATADPRSKLQSLDLPLTHEPRIPATAEPRSRTPGLDLPLTHEPRIPATVEPRSKLQSLDLPLTHEQRSRTQGVHPVADNAEFDARSHEHRIGSVDPLLLAEPEPETGLPVQSEVHDPEPPQRAEPWLQQLPLSSAVGRARFDVRDPARVPRPVIAPGKPPVAVRPPPKPASRAWLWSNVLLVLALLGQIAYSERNRWLALPQIRKLLDTGLGWFGQQLPPRVDTKVLSLTSRDIRPHTGVSGALLITASMRNTSELPVAFPKVEIRMTDLTGKAVALRRFTPDEYLSDASTIAAGLEPEALVPLVFEVVDPGRDALNFEFAFRAP